MVTVECWYRPSIVGEQAALAIKTLAIDRNSCHPHQLEKPWEQFCTDMRRSRNINILWQKVWSTVTCRQRIQHVGCCRRPTKLVDLQWRLIGRKRDQVTPVGREFAQKTRRLLDVYDGVVRKHVCKEFSRRGACVPAASPSSMQLARH